MIPHTGHVIPLQDTVQHEIDLEGECPCGPLREEYEGSLLFVHHSLDGRELREDKPGSATKPWAYIEVKPCKPQ